MIFWRRRKEKKLNIPPVNTPDMRKKVITLEERIEGLDKRLEVLERHVPKVE